MSVGLVSGSDDHGRGFRRIVELLIWLVVLPTAALLALGVLMLVFWEAQLNVVFGILVVTLVGCLTTGTVLALVLLGREARLSKLQLDFVSKVSHELRTPLTSIRMFAEMLRSDSQRDPQERALCLEVLERETSRLSERIERLLDWGRMEAGRRVYERRPEDVAGVVDEALSAFQTAIMGQDQPVQVVLEPDLPKVVVDRGALVDALVNLLSNAYKYTGDEKWIELKVHADPRTVRISVSDNGIGIPRREQHRIFQKFYRADERLSREVEGSGLGLAIVRHIAVGHGGRVEVSSQLGRGSTFTMILPRKKTKTPAEARALDETTSKATA